MRSRLLVVALVLAAACGADDDEPEVLATSSTAPAPVPTACPVEDGAVAFAIGAPVTGTFTAAGRSATCTWSFDGGSITLNLERGGGEVAHGQYARMTSTEPVSGLGDEAAWVPGQRVLSVLDGGDVYMVLVEGLDDPLAVATEVARLALAAS